MRMLIVPRSRVMDSVKLKERRERLPGLGASRLVLDAKLALILILTSEITSFSIKYISRRIIANLIYLSCNPT